MPLPPTTPPQPGNDEPYRQAGKRIKDVVGEWTDRLVALSHDLHAEPELAFEEHRSCAKVLAVARSAGFEVQTPVCGLDTAFVATAGRGDLVIALCAEYDALPGIGHACGHNVNAASATGAAIALGAVAEDLGIRVVLVGTPAEETAGGKIILLEGGVFDDVAAAMMVHAGGQDDVGFSSYALSTWNVEFTGVPAHAATAPWMGANAADALTLAYQAVGLLRQQLAPDQLVSFLIRQAGEAVNVIPALARGQIEMRARTGVDLLHLQERITRCLDAGALATGTTVRVTPDGNPFEALHQDVAMTRAYTQALRDLGRRPVDGQGAPLASTDMGNLSQVIPSIHPTIGYDVAGAAHHTPDFAAHGTSAAADQAVVDGAIGLALVGAQMALDPAERSRLLDGVRQRHDVP